MGNAMIFGGARMTAPVGGLPLSDLIEGQIVMIPKKGVLTPFYLAKHDYESGLNGAGRDLFVEKDCYDKRMWNSSYNNTYATSEIDTWLNGDYTSLFDTTVQDAMSTTKFYYTSYTGSTGMSTLERATFLLSVTELGKTESAANTEGSVLPIASTLHIAYINGSAVTQWTRSQNKGYSADAFYLDINGNVKRGHLDGSHSSRPCFTLPSTMLVGSEPNADGSVNLMY